jgi:type II secretion system protein I
MIRIPLRTDAHGLHPVGADERGMTLLEVVLAMAIFVGSLAVMSQLVWNGSRAAVQSQLQTQALVRCEAKLAEIVVGASPLQAGSGTYTDNTNWSFSVTTESTQYPELMVVEVTVMHTGGSSLGNVTQTLRRWMRDPALFEAAAIAQQEAAAEAASSSSSTLGTSSGSR